MNKNEFLLITPDLLKLAKKTGQYQMEYHKKTVKFKVKDDKTPVTEIDINSSNMIKNILQKIIPGVPVISEEDQPTTNNADYFWIIDFIPPLLDCIIKLEVNFIFTFKI